MKLDDFINELQKAGWQAVSDAQHENIKYLHRQLFPVIADLEDDLESAEEALKHHGY
tara:strand:- start:4798 stop:4968 length:171 start_codon:yes stop_codon:yes gene_type:complete